MNSCELSMSITAVANAIAAQMTDEELEMASVVITQLGDTLETIAALRMIENKRCAEAGEGHAALPHGSL